VSIDYFLKSPADTATIELVDAKGVAIRTFTGSAAQAAEAETTRAAGEEGGDEGPRAPVVPRVPVKQGMNRFTWDLRYPGARDFPGLIMWAGNTRGPQAPPGRYVVKLTANGITRSQELTIKRNEAVRSVTDADLEAQFQLARQINARLNAANEAVVRIRSVKDQISASLAKTRDGAITAAGKILTDRLTAIEGEIYQYRNRSSQDPLNFPIRLNNKLAALQGIVEFGDNRPTDQAYAVFGDLAERLDAQLTQLDALARTDLAALNKLLVKKRIDAVKDGVPAVGR
jgi:hypothetical protein